MADESPSPNPLPLVDGEAEPAVGAAPPPSRLPSRTPFTSLSQVDADLALARAIQEQVSLLDPLSLSPDPCLRVSEVLGFGEFLVQERAYMMLRMNGGQGSDFESSDAGSYEYEDGDDPGHPIDEVGSAEGSDYGEDAFDANDRSVDPAEFESDEAFARALQDAEEAEVAVRLMALAGLNDWGMEDHGDHGSHSQVSLDSHPLLEPQFA
ncbi:putative E3 ubiquitin ligase BIG BROTHER-related [Cocos nucifera]|nr:putative E3 ubiquitin ligase BIG BROTHER-related [Cocos nucifera]